MKKIHSRKIHRWISFVVGLPLAWIALTGTALAVAQIWQDACFPYRLPLTLQHPTDQTPRLSEEGLQSALSQVEQKNRIADLRGVRVLPAAASSARLIFKNGEIWFFAPTNGEVFAKKEASSFDPIKILTQLHRGKILGTFGRILFSVFAVLAVLLVASGTWILKRRRQHRRSWHSFHGNLAVILGLPLLLLLVSGGFWNLSGEMRTIKIVPMSGKILVGDWQQALHTALGLLTEEVPQEIFVTEGRILVAFRNSARVYLNTQESEVHRPYTWTGWWEPLWSIHSGNVLGKWGILFPLIVGLLTLAIAVAGFLISLGRR